MSSALPVQFPPVSLSGSAKLVLPSWVTSGRLLDLSVGSSPPICELGMISTQEARPVSGQLSSLMIMVHLFFMCLLLKITMRG